MNTWWFSAAITAIIAAILKSRKTVRLYFVAQLVNTLAVFAASHWFAHYYLGVYIATTLPILECCVFLLWDAGITWRQIYPAAAFGLLVGAIGAEYAGDWTPGKWVTFIEGGAFSTLGMAMALVKFQAEEWATVRTLGALSLAASVYDFAFVRGWKETNSWLPAALCAVAFWKIVLRKDYGRLQQCN